VWSSFHLEQTADLKHLLEEFSMNKLMLGAAAVALTLAVSPAFAADDSGVKLGLGGYFKGYANYTNEDTAKRVDFLRDTEVHFGGETTLDNGLTVGAHIEATADGGDGFGVDESYIYFAGSWGRVNAGKEDGAAYLLQVAAPSADDNIDGIRQFINPTTFTSTDYAADTSRGGDKLTYLSPVFSGFQGGVSYTPNVKATASNGLTGNGTNLQDEAASEAALRYEGMVGSVGLIAGAGYTATTQEANEWNAGVDLDIGAFGLGAVYKDATAGNVNSAILNDVKTWAVGTDYTTGPFKIGASYLNNDFDGVVANSVSDRYAAGVVYSYGPGMTFRGSVGYTEADNVTGGRNDDATTVSVGTQVNF
jgi:outer membrane protein OmpU